MRLSAPLFGVAGFPPNFFKSEFGKKRENIFAWLNQLGLDWIELQNTYGVKMKDDQAQLYKKLGNQHGIGISIHGPYFISLASSKEEVVVRSRERVLQCIHLADTIQSSRIIFHPGYCAGKTVEDRSAGIRQIIDELLKLKDDIPKGMYLYPETAGKKSQLGSLDEILQICDAVEFARPCLDLAHIHGFQGGSLWTAEDIANIFDTVSQRFGRDYLKDIHVHMYPVDFDHNGEKKHKAFADIIDVSSAISDTDVSHVSYHPQSDNFITAIKKLDISPVVVCEARDTQDVGALLMKQLFDCNLVEAT